MPDYQSISELSLYHFKACPFCSFTCKAIKQLGLDIKLKDINQNPKDRTDLVKGGGKSQVPSLRITTKNGSVKWVYDSMDIVHYLRGYQQHINAINKS